MTRKPSNIVLIGMPGAGKSTVGVILAKLTSRAFVDTDLLIQTSQTRSLQDIVDHEGHLALRRIEEDVLLGLDCRNHVIATGGSLVSDTGTYKLLRSRCLCVWLRASPEEHMARVIAQGDMRPFKGRSAALDEIRQLLADPSFTKVISIGRRRLPVEHPKLTQVIADLSSPSALASLDPPECAFSCLGTTMKRAGTRDAFRALDYGAGLPFAGAARQKGAGTFVHVSSLGADVGSRAFYLAVKGEVERDVALRPITIHDFIRGIRTKRR